MILIYIHGFNSGYHPGGYKIASLQKMATVYGVAYDSFAIHDEVYRTLRQQLGTMLENLQAGESGEGGDGLNSLDERQSLDEREGRESCDGFGREDLDSRGGSEFHDGRNAIALVGTSLGGYWAARFGNHFGIPAVLINPTIHPHQSLRRYVGHKLLNFVTRSRNILRDEVPASYGDIERSGDFLVLLDKGDEVLDYHLAEKWFVSGNNSADSGKNGDPSGTAQPPETASETVRRDSCKVLTFEGGSHRFSHMEEALPHIRQFLSRYFASQQDSSAESPSDQHPSGQSRPR